MDNAGALPVHGFVLAGGQSTRMGEDKALLRFCGRPMVEIAVEKLREFCAEVSIAGNRDDLAQYAPVVHEERANVGPAAGVEAGLRAATQPWVMFIPVDVPLLPAELLGRWAKAVIQREGLAGSNLYYGIDQPAFCMLRRDCANQFSAALEGGERRLSKLLSVTTKGSHWVQDRDEMDASDGYLSTEVPTNRWFMNLNTREELAEAEAWARAQPVGRRGL
jgi:molybdopterin-guanine dinucleotide biosynthesis protein A